MKKQLLFFSLLTLSLYSCATRNFFKENEENEKEAHIDDPRYYEQWFNDHKNENGEIPFGMTDIWADFDKKSLENGKERGTSPITTVTNLANNNFHGGRTRSILVSSLDSNKIFAGSVSGGLWRSEDAGISWKAINDQAANLSVTCIVENPFNPNEIYYGTGEVRGGSQPPGDGVYKSVDGGLTFAKIASTNIGDMRYCNYMQHSLIDSSTVWLGTSLGLFKTVNSGTTWTKIAGGSVSGIVAMPDSSMLVSYIGGKIFRSATGKSGTFTAVVDTTNLFPKGINGRILLANCKNVPNVVYSFFTTTTSNYFGEGDRGVFRSNDGGITWARPFSDTIRIGSVYQAYCQVLGVHSSNPEYLMVGGVNCKYSKNGGKTWATLPIGHSDNHAYVNFGKNNEFLAGSDGGIYKHTWDKITTAPKDMNKAYASAQYYAGNYGVSGKTAVGGTQDNGSWRYVNGVLTKIYGGDGAYSHLSLQNNKLAYVSTQNGNTYRMDNYASSTTAVNITPKLAVAEGVDFINEHQINYADGNQLYYRTSKGLWRTIDKGLSWDRLNENNFGSTTAVGVTNDSNPTVYIGGANTLYRIDSAATVDPVKKYTNLYKKMPTAIQGTAWGNISFNPQNKNTMYVTFSSISASNSRIWKVDNAHTDTTMVWTNLGANLPKNLSVYQLQPHPEQPDSVFFAATSFGLYTTTNAGATWEKETRVPNVAIFELKLRASDRTLFLFTHGRGLWYLELKDLLTPTADAVSKLDFSISPNPARDIIRINTDEEITAVQIFDLQGRVLIEAQNEKEIPISTLSDGFYILKIYDKNGKFVSKKFLKG